MGASGAEAHGLIPQPRPANPRAAREVLKAEACAAPDAQLVRMEAVEFTSICPRTGQPDFGRVVIEYAPARKCLESMAQGMGVICRGED